MVVQAALDEAKRLGRRECLERENAVAELGLAR
jgi:hypothetical protein